MVSKKLDARASAWLKTLTLLVFLVVAAVVSEVFLHRRIDLTRDKEFTLAPVAIRTLDGLRNKVTVRVVMSKGLPPEFARIRTRLVDMLHEFEARSGGRLELVFQDLGDGLESDSLARVAALSLGIEEVLFQEQTRTGLKARKGFFGLALLYGDKKEYFPVLRSVETFEYDMVVRLKKLTGVVKTVGFVETSAGAAVNTQQFSVLKTRMEPLYRIDPQSPEDSALAARIDLLLVAAPAHLTEAAKNRIDAFVMEGKPVIFLTPGIDVDLSNGIEAVPTDNGYEDLLVHYGINPRKNLLLEPDNWERVRFGEAEFPVPYPYWITLSYNTLNAENPVTASLHALSFPWVSALEVNPVAQPDARYETLAATSSHAWEQSWEEVDTTLLYPRALKTYTPTASQSFPLAVMVTGSLTPFHPSASPTQARGDARVLVISNARFVSDSYADYLEAATIESNFQFVLGAMDQFVLDPGLIRLRSRELSEAPLNETRAKQSKTLILLLNMGVGPLCVLLVGGLFYLFRWKGAAR